MEPTALELPADDWLGWLDRRGTDQLQAARDRVAQLVAAEPGSDTILPLWNDASIALRNAGAIAGLLSSVHPDAAVIERAEALEVEVEGYSTDLYLDTAVFAALDSVPVDGLDEDARRLQDKVLRAFRRSGVDRGDEVRARVRTIEAALTERRQSFSRNIRDGRRTTPRTGVRARPDCPRTTSRATPPMPTAWSRSRTDYPDMLPFLTFSSRPGRPARHGRASLLQPRLARQRPGARRPARGCGTNGHPARLRRLAAATTPRSR